MRSETKARDLLFYKAGISKSIERIGKTCKIYSPDSDNYHLLQDMQSILISELQTTYNVDDLPIDDIIKPELNPCPFCGGNNLKTSSPVLSCPPFITCEDCYVRMSGSDKEDANRRWNNRAIDKEKKQLIECLQHIVIAAKREDDFDPSFVIQNAESLLTNYKD